MRFKTLSMAAGAALLAFATSAAADNLAFRTVSFDEYSGSRSHKHTLNIEGIKQFAAEARDSQDLNSLRCVARNLSKSTDPATLRQNHDLITGFVSAAGDADATKRARMKIYSVNDAVGLVIAQTICTKPGQDLALVKQ